jgi:hypothetical protein
MVNRIEKPPPRKSSNKAKGNRFERKVAGLLGGKRMALSGAAGGGDVVAEGWSIECKKRKTLPALLLKAFGQAERDIAIGDPRRPLVVIEQDRGRAIACLYLDDLVSKLYDEGPERSFKVREIFRAIEGMAKEGRDLA